MIGKRTFPIVPGVHVDIELIKKFGYRVAPGAVIFREGESATKLYVILQGEVDIFLRVKNSQKLVATLSQGDIFGEMAVVDAKPRSATAIAKTEVKCLALGLEQAEILIKSNPSFAIRIIRLLSRKLREANETITEILSKDRRKHIGEALLAHAKQSGKKGFKGWRINTASFLDEADNFLGMDREDVRRTLQDLIKEGYIDYASNTRDELILQDKLEMMR